MKFKQLIILFISLVGFTQAQISSGQDSVWVVPEKQILLQALDSAYNLNFTYYNKQIEQYKKRYPQRPEGTFAPVVEWWLRIMTDIYNPEYDAAFSAALDEVNEKLEDYDSDDPLYDVAQFYLGATAGFQAIIHVLREQWFSAAYEGRKAISTIEQTIEGRIPNLDARFGSGLYLYYTDIVPKKYPILKPLFYFYPEGDKKRGLEDLKLASEKGVFAKVISAYMYATILYTKEKALVSSLKIFKDLNGRYPMNPTFLMWETSVATALREFELAEKNLLTFKKRMVTMPEFYPKHKQRVINYKYGMLYFKKRVYSKAIPYFKQATMPIEGELEHYLERYKAYALLHMAYCYSSIGNDAQSKILIEQVLELKDVNKTHHFAKAHLKRIAAREAKKKPSTK